LGDKFFLLRTRISSFFSRHRVGLRRVYWGFAILLVVAIIAVPVTFALTNPDVRIPMTHGGPPRELVRDWEVAVAQLNREQTRLHDFTFVINHLWESYPFLEMAEARGMDFFGQALAAFEELEEVAAYATGAGFLTEFIETRILSYLGGYGGVRLSGDPQGMPDWILHPYFFGFYDPRFTDDRIEQEVRGENFGARRIGGVGYVTINRFLPKGYEDITRMPFWYFDFEEEQRQLLEVYRDLLITDGVERIVIDIRGIGSGFGDYFVPLVLEPLINEPVSARGYGFHSDSPFARRIGGAFREWYGFSELSSAASLAVGFDYALPFNVVHGFVMDVTASPLQLDFDGEIWLLTDSANFSGPNFLYLQMAADAGFVIFYEENAEAIGWGTSLARLPNSSVSLRYNPIFFTDAAGRPFEGVRPTEWVGNE